MSTKDAAKAVKGSYYNIAKAIKNKRSYKNSFWSWLLMPNEMPDFSQYIILTNTVKDIGETAAQYKQIHNEKIQAYQELIETILQLWNDGKTTGEIAEIVAKVRKSRVSG